MRKIFGVLMFFVLILNLTFAEALKTNIKIDERTLSSIYFIPGEKTGFMKDKNGVYYIDSSNPQQIKFTTISTDVNGFRLLGCYKVGSLNNCYYKDSKNVFFLITGLYTINIKTIKNADNNTFKVLDKSFAVDKNYVYFSGNRIPGADANTFQIIDKNYSKDKNLVFVGISEIVGADAKTFTILDSYRLYSKDKNKVFRNTTEIKGANPNTFKIIDEYFSKDDKNIYLVFDNIDDADIDTFKILKETSNYVYSSDKNNVYYNWYKIEGADPTTFTLIESKKGSYAKDKNNVYLNGVKIKGANPKTFKVK